MWATNGLLIAGGALALGGLVTWLVRRIAMRRNPLPRIPPVSVVPAGGGISLELSFGGAGWPAGA
jgi:hypothetical protein